MTVYVIASGSKGNMMLIKDHGICLAIDVGISYRKMILKLQEIKLDIKDITHVLLTHEHGDHTQGLQALLKHGQIEGLYATKGTLDALRLNSEVLYHIIESKVPFKLFEFDITPFLISHDAKEPVGFVIQKQTQKIVVISDSGYVDETYDALLKEAQLYVVEANHHPQLLLSSPRPMALKKRILSEKGHLSNDDVVYLMNKWVTQNTTWIATHISEDCNSELEIEKSMVKLLDNPLKVDVKFSYQHNIVSVEI
jgi:phosphoribosyl 1,2-cyclic phosphodiesterase